MTRTTDERIKSEALRRANALRREAVNALWDRLAAALRGNARRGALWNRVEA
jgi:hypothetical protein